jgi:hypothetical protein
MERHLKTTKHINNTLLREKDKKRTKKDKKGQKTNENVLQCVKISQTPQELNDNKSSKYDVVKSNHHTNKKSSFNSFSSFFPKFECKVCDFYTDHKSKYNRHIHTQKHKNLIEQEKTNTIIDHPTNQYVCDACNKSYKYQSGLSRHKQKCSKNETDIIVSDNQSIDKKEEVTTEMVMNLLKTNRELQDIICNQNKEIIELAKQPRNQIINIENYLNIECKDAINMSDFINQIQITLEDLLYLGNNGFSKSVQNLMMNSLKDMEQTKRPIHCVNKKKKTLYIKDKDKWEKDKDQEQIRQVIHKFHRKELNDAIDVMDKNADFFQQIDNLEKRNNIIIGITTGNKEEAIKNITKHITQNMYIDNK